MPAQTITLAPAPELPYPEVAGWKYSTTGRRRCWWCGQMTSEYFRDADTRNLCRVCYPVVNASILDDLPDPARPWLTALGMRYIRAATAEEIAARDAYYRETQVFLPASFPHLVEDTHEHEWRSRPLAPAETVWCYDSDEDGRDPLDDRSRLSSHAQSIYSKARDRYVIFPSQCVVCGNYGRLQGTGYVYDDKGSPKAIGMMHTDCWEVLSNDPAKLAAAGIYRLSCGHYSTVQETVEDTTCIDCGKQIQRTVGCGRCVAQRTRRCYRCAVFAAAANGQHQSLSGLTGINPRFDLLGALADFYVLTQLRELSPLAEPLYYERTIEIANQLFRYAVIAAGGELRHIYDQRANYFSLVLGVWRPPHEDDDREGYFCACGEVDHCTQSQEHDHATILGVVGAMGTPPFRKDANIFEGIPEADSAHAMRGPVTWRGTTYKIASLTSGRRFRLATALRSGGRDYGRDTVWERYWDRFVQYGAPLLKLTRDLFLTGQWGSSYGGYWWGIVSDLTYRLATREITPPVFIDAMFGAQHNNGTIFNKLWVTTWPDIDLVTLLDLKRRVKDWRALLPFTTGRVRELVTQLAEATGRPSFQTAAYWIAETRGMDGADELTHWQQLMGNGESAHYERAMEPRMSAAKEDAAWVAGGEASIGEEAAWAS